MDSLDRLAAEVFLILGNAGVPAEIIGGYALSHYGYVRNTMDVDIVVTGDHLKIIDVLKAHGFVEGARWFKLQDPAIPGKHVDILPAGKRMSGSVVPNPTPFEVSKVPTFIRLQDLIALKLGVILNSGAGVFDAKKNEVDVQALIQANNLNREFMAEAPSQDIYLEFTILWDELRQKRASSLDTDPDPFREFFENRDRDVPQGGIPQP